MCVMKIGIVGINNKGLDDRDKQKAMEKVMSIFKKYPNAEFYTVKPENGGVNTIVDLYGNSHEQSVKIIDTGTSLDSWKIAHQRLAAKCDKIYCISTIFRKQFCYHCMDSGHEKAGGCLAIKHGKVMNKEVELIAV